jgi:hypothetical protein
MMKQLKTLFIAPFLYLVQPNRITAQTKIAHVDTNELYYENACYD